MPNLKHQIKPWLPPALIQLYRQRRHDPRANPQFALPARALDALFPGVEAATVAIPASQVARTDEWAVPAAELLAMAAICAALRPRRIFEIGTYTGATTLIMALNTPPETEIFTLDLDPAARPTHQHGTGVGSFPEFTVGAAYLSHPAATKIRQLYGDTRGFDYAPYAGTIDLVFVDADHTYDFVKADTARALIMLRAGGTIVWDDYIWNERHPECAGVTRCLNELAATRSVVRLAGTRFGVYRDAARE